LNWNAALKQYGMDSLNHGGYVPYYVMTVKNKLTNAFRKGDKDTILFYAADLAHYISDAHVPLHVTENYDGQLTGQKGLHSLWESTIPELEINKYDLGSNHKAQYLKQPQRAIWKAIRQSHALLKDVFKQEKAATRAFTDSTKYRTQIRKGKEYKSYTSAFARAYSARLGKTVNQQLVRSADMVADFWYTCWVDAGRPNLRKLKQAQLSKQEKQQLQLELQAFKQNKLLEKKLLLSKQQQQEDE
jgi:hypothetical protein